jgi:hypothetical protein
MGLNGRATGMIWAGAITLAIALLGAVLGIINTLHQLNRDRVRLRVTPKVVNLISGGNVSDSKLCIEVINLSTFAVTVCGVGFKSQKHDLLVINPLLYDGGIWPRRLEPRQSVTAFLSEDWKQNKDIPLARKAFARTECGVSCYGSIKQLKKQLR